MASAPGRVALWQETLPQHFNDSRNGHNWKRANKKNPGCAPRATQRNTTQVYNAIARRIIRNVPWIPLFDIFDKHYEYHAHGTDCTHYCFVPALWAAALNRVHKALQSALLGEGSPQG